MRLLLVDDEPLTTASLKEHMKWEELGIGEVEIASNGLQAMELIRWFQPNIVVSDVRMPRMDGIELASHVYESYPNIKFIFLSGYSDKEYLKAAIHLKAVRYIEKPVKLNELSEAITESVSILSYESENRKFKRSAIRKRVIQQLLSASNTNEYLDSRDDEHEIYLSAAVTPFTIRITIQSDISDNEAVATKENVFEWLDREVSADELFGAVDSQTFLYLSKTSLEVPATSLAKEWIQRLKNQFSPKVAFSVGVGHSAVGYQRIRSSCGYALSAVNAQFYDGPGLIYTALSIPSKDDSNLLTEAMCRGFRTTFHEYNLTEATCMLDHLTLEARNRRSLDIPSVINVFFRLSMILHEFAVERDLTIYSETQKEKFIWRDILQLNTLDALRDYLLGNIQAVFSIWKEQSSVSAKVGNVIAYIRKHYSNTGLSTSFIAEQTYLSLSYMCALFKRETGKTVNEYLTDYRLEKSKEFLTKQHLKLYEVASMVGFADANYFSFIFKKATGMTPSDYRERERA